MSADLTPAVPSAEDVLRAIPAGQSPKQQRNFDDLRHQTRAFVLTLLATVPPGPSRTDALLFLRRAVTAAVVGIMRGPR